MRFHRDIEQDLQNLILKYDIARCMPLYRQCLAACHIIQQMVADLDSKKITVIGSREMDIQKFLNLCNEEYIPLYDYVILDPETDFNTAPAIDEDSIIIFVSKKHSGRWMPYLRHHFAEKRILNLYDYLEEKGLFFASDYYDVFVGNRESDYERQDMSQIFFNDRCQYEQIQDSNLRRKYLERMIFDALYCKDFLTAEELIKRYISENKECGRANKYCKFLEELHALLNDIRNMIKQNAKEDIFFFWIDAVDRIEMEKLSFFRKKKSDGIFFNNAYTVTSNTKPTYRTLFHKMREISDKGYQHRSLDPKDSNLIQALKDRGYHFEVFGESMPTKKIDLLHTKYCCFSELCWDAIKKSVFKSEKTFYLLHEQSHTHPGYGSIGNFGHYFYEDNSNLIYSWATKAPGLLLKRREESLKYMDQQLHYWEKFFPPEAYKIYMSDHGNGMVWANQFHVFMLIDQKKLNNYFENRIFSYYDFDDMLLSLLDDGKISEEVFHGAAFIEDLPLYAESAVFRYLNSKPCKIPIAQLGEQGVITDKGAYFIFGNGQEIYLRMDGKKSPIMEQDIQQIRNTFQYKQLDYTDSRFVYSNILMDKYNWITQHEGKNIKTINTILCNMAQQLDGTQCIAIRGGGLHTIIMLMQLPELREKISYIVDMDVNAGAGKMGYKVITPKNAWKEKKIDVLILSSFSYRTEWKNEAVRAEIPQIIDPYYLFEKNGITCKADYYIACYDPEEE